MIEGFPADCWYATAWSRELSGGALLDRTILGERLVLYRTEQGKVIALRNRCPHRSAPLTLGHREGDSLRCGYHGMLFGSDGRCTAIPGQDKIPDTAVVRSYPVVDRNGWVWVWPGEPALADPAAVPVVTGLDDPAWMMRAGYVHYKAGAHLLHDNLLDFSHVQFVHAKSFGGGANWADKPDVQRLENGFRFQHWLANVPVAPFLRELMPDAPNQDILNEYEFLLPGILTLDTQSQTAGTGTRGALSRDGYFHSMSCQAVTPETATTAHYFFANGIPTGAPEAALEVMYKGTLMAFEEDRTMIEAQQAQMLADPEQPISLAGLAADAPIVQMRAMLRKRALAETDRGKAAAE
jgi:vanillate O-demethylase monooxygenase subunit